MNAPLDIARRLLRLPARLPVGLRARCRGDRKEPHRARAPSPDHPYTQGRRMRESGALFGASITPTGSRGPCGALTKRFSAVCADLLGRSARPRRRGVPESRARMGHRRRWLLHAGTMGRDARRDRPADPRQALFSLFRQHLRRRRVARLHCRNRAACPAFRHRKWRSPRSS